mmetsp:Transcript_26746/g.58638  ORF Transcript_26746/g.58638 Transcript_26746/m.58638 type:complete len:100 (-) Transcript_26746:34-333(-)
MQRGDDKDSIRFDSIRLAKTICSTQTTQRNDSFFSRANRSETIQNDSPLWYGVVWYIDNAMIQGVASSQSIYSARLAKKFGSASKLSSVLRTVVRVLET